MCVWRIAALYAVEISARPLVEERCKERACEACHEAREPQGVNPKDAEGLNSTVEPLLTHTPPLQIRAMGYEGLWPIRVVLKIDKKLD